MGQAVEKVGKCKELFECFLISICGGEFWLWLQRQAPDLHLNQFYLNNIIHSTLISHLSFLALSFFCVYMGLGRIWPSNVNMKENHDNTVGWDLSWFFFFHVFQVHLAQDVLRFPLFSILHFWEKKNK